jgi:hypothetical protein
MALFTVVRRNIVKDTEIVSFEESKGWNELLEKLTGSIKRSEEGIFVYSITEPERDYKYMGIPFFARTTREERKEMLLGWVRHNLDVEPYDFN